MGPKNWARATPLSKPSPAGLDYGHAGFNEAVPRMLLIVKNHKNDRE